MKKITKINRQVARRLAEAIEEVVCHYVANEGLDLHVTNKGGTYSDTEYTLRLNLAVIDESGQVLSAEAKAYDESHQFLGLADFPRGTTFRANGKTEYAITGWNSRARRFPVQVVRTSDGATFKFALDAVRQALGVKDKVSV